MNRWSDSRAPLLDGPQWEAVQVDVLHGLSLEAPVGEHLAERVRALDAAWQLMAERLEEAGQDTKLSFEVQPDGRLKLNVDRLGALGEPKLAHHALSFAQPRTSAPTLHALPHRSFPLGRCWTKKHPGIPARPSNDQTLAQRRSTKPSKSES
ncbi:hypothetical protein GCM10009663_57450 [Kitasatospora arboriphila]|uniref:Uncharacterized protein n=1 Tax=Kitasatospora arboriphila TaxID=258052 RepID=A0ABP4EK85_9ACTN